MLFIPKSFIFFSVLYDHVTCDCDICDNPVTGVMSLSYLVICVTVTLHPLLFFLFLNQQFITWHMEVDYGSYFVTTYRRTKLHEGRGNDKEEEKIKQGTNWKGDPRPKERNKLLVTLSSTQSDWWNIVRKGESFRIRSQKHNEVIEGISSGVPVSIVICAFIEDMSSSFNCVLST